MTNKFFGCLEPSTGFNLVGITQCAGLIAGVTLLVLTFTNVLTSAMHYPYELPIMLICAFFLPCLAYLDYVVSPFSSSKSSLPYFYLFSHLSVQLYALISPFILLRGQYDSPNKEMSAKPMVKYCPNGSQVTVTINGQQITY